MTGAERGFLLLCSQLGDPERKPLTLPQLRELKKRMTAVQPEGADRDVECRDLLALGYGMEAAERIVHLLSEEALLERYLQKGRRSGCVPLTRLTQGYPQVLKNRLGPDCPGCLWAKGDPALLARPAISLVGSRMLEPDNAAFAAEVGRQAAIQGYTLVSGNAAGADRTAQDSCLAAGGSVISVVATALQEQRQQKNVLWLAEEDYDRIFSPQRALSRNRVIHALGDKTFVAQSALECGGTWDGSVRNLRFGWSPVLCFDDGSPAVRRLCVMGAEPIGKDELQSISTIIPEIHNLFDQ